MEKIVQVISATTNLYAVWMEENEGKKEYGVDRAYYLGLSDEGEVYPLIIERDGYMDTFNCDGYMMFDWDGYQWWRRHKAELPVNEYFNRFEREQKGES